YAQAVKFDLRYPGQVFDEETGLSYNLHRYYDAATGRYMQADPIGLEGGWNRFGYVGGDPLSFADPMGLTHKANSAHCSALRRKMQNLQNDLDDRWSDLAADRLNLPERIGPGESLSQTKRGHRTMINEREGNLRKFEKRYMDECEDDEDADGGQSCDTGCAVVGATVGFGAGYVAYRCLRMLPSLLPPFWSTIPANFVVP
ncbi:RHS repeat-associated core domain-containing protein, partial [Delftia sp.]